MKALSLKQPWARIMIKGYKDVENRNWRTDYRGPLLIHASKNWSQDGFDFLCGHKGLWVPRRENHVFGALIGIVDLVDCVDRHDSEWFWGDWGWIFKNPREFKKPIPWRGNLGLFDVPDEAIERKLPALGGGDYGMEFHSNQ